MPAAGWFVAVVVAAAVTLVPASAAASRSPSARATAELAEIDGTADFGWPVAPPFRLAEPYVSPPHEYGAGHRGIDLTLLGATAVVAPSGGVVAFAGHVADRRLVTIAHPGGLVTTLEPVDPSVSMGDRVALGEEVGTLSAGGHTRPGRVHWGVRLDGEYINPLLLVGGIPRAVLLPMGD